MKKFNLIFAVLLISVIACKKDDPVNPDTLISPEDEDALVEVLIMPDQAQRENGTPPTPSGGNAPNVTSPAPNVQSSNGSTAPLYFIYSDVVTNLGGCYVYVDGAGSYWNIPYNGNSGNSGQLQVPIGIPTNVDQGDFCVEFSVYDSQGRISDVVVSCITVLRLGTGALQVSLSWSNDSDQDLYVRTPNGEEIYYSNDFDSTGGQLDRDDLDGYGPENIFWLENAPNGTYTVLVNDYEGVPTGTNFYVTVSGPNTSRSFNGFTQNGNTVTVTTFTKSGNAISF